MVDIDDVLNPIHNNNNSKKLADNSNDMAAMDSATLRLLHVQRGALLFNPYFPAKILSCFSCDERLNIGDQLKLWLIFDQIPADP